MNAIWIPGPAATGHVIGSIPWETTKGLAQGLLNLANAATDLAIDIPNTVPWVYNNTVGWFAPNCPYIPSPDWSNDLIVTEPFWCHEYSKAGGEIAAVALPGAALLGKIREAQAAAAAQKAAAERAAFLEFTDEFRGIERPGAFPKPEDYVIPPPKPKPRSGYDGWLPPEDQYPY